jgi:hypothetical protein
MLRRVALVRTHVSEKRSASFIGVTRICEQETTLAVTSNRRTQSASGASYSLFLVTDSCHPDEGGAKFHRNVGATRRNIPEDTILHIRCYLQRINK